jgi:hypothetical protein
VGSCEYDNEPFRFINGVDCLKQLIGYQLLKKGPVPRSQFVTEDGLYQTKIKRFTNETLTTFK